MPADERLDADNLRKARIGNHQAFRALVEPYQKELQRHCYRMTGSYDDADDLVQETLFRAWRALGTYVSHGTFRAWLYRIATNRTLDLLGSAPRRREVVNSAGEPAWLQPYPIDEDTTGDAAADLDQLGLAFVVALQGLNAKQRAALLLCDVLGFTAAEAAETCSTTPTAINSLLQRARATMVHVDAVRRIEPQSPEQDELVTRFVEAWRIADTNAMIQLLDPNAHLTMPPHDLEFQGADAIVDLLLDPVRFAQYRDVRWVATRANGEAGFATYIRQSGTEEATRHCVMLLGGATSAASKITGFTEDRIFDLLGLPERVEN